MPRTLARKSPSQIKAKYHAKTTSDTGIATTWLRLLDVSEIYAEYVWLQISAFDLTELGLGLLYSILPVDFEPYAIDFEYKTPTTEETLQGIWAKFEPIRFDQLYRWMTDFREYVIENIKEEFQADLIAGIAPKAIYGITPWGRGVYDPVIAREFLRSTFYKLRLMRTPDISWLSMMDQIAEFIEMVGVTDEHIFNRLMMIFSAQTNAFVLGLSLLGRSRLTETDGDYGVVPIMDAKGNIHDLKFRTLDHLQMGFILGVTPLGYGLLLPKESIYKLPEGKKNPTIIKVLTEKILGMIRRLTLTTWAYSNYNKPEEMVDYHKSDKANQYDLLQSLRRHIERWVEARIPPEESNTVRIRQYQNAFLQLISWKAKRHSWGYKGWEAMTDEQFKDWWLQYWESQGLNTQILQQLHEGSKLWLKRVQDVKVRLGERVKQRRLRLALSP